MKKISIDLWFSISAILLSVMHSNEPRKKNCISLLYITVYDMLLVTNAGKMAVTSHQSEFFSNHFYL